jgi:endogenous inhibitor of DNA gyrase (YacG/DUF329 family)
LIDPRIAVANWPSRQKIRAGGKMSAMRSALCALCRRQPVNPAWRPFCSERCKLQDLARWVDGSYKVPGEPAGNPEEEETDKAQRSTLS